jgi:hypothetical protein
MRRHFDDCDQLCDYVAEVQGHRRVLLAFSCGKDAIGAWLQLRRAGFDVIPSYRYLIPRLGFVEDSLRYYEGWFGTKIIRVPHPSIYRMLNNLMMQAPERCLAIEQAELGLYYDYNEANRVTRKVAGCPMNTFCATGVRLSDSVQRRTAGKAHGVLNPRDLGFWPVFDWTAQRLDDEITEAGVELPVDYELWGRTFDGVDLRFLKPLKERFPEDYAKVLEWFPLAELEILRSELRPGWLAKQQERAGGLLNQLKGEQARLKLNEERARSNKEQARGKTKKEAGKTR